jgi:hypothetical protein
MSQRVCDLYDDRDFEDLLNDAKNSASGSWEDNFISDLESKYETYGSDMFLSDLQNDHLARIASKD